MFEWRSLRQGVQKSAMVARRRRAGGRRDRDRQPSRRSVRSVLRSPRDRWIKSNIVRLHRDRSRVVSECGQEILLVEGSTGSKHVCIPELSILFRSFLYPLEYFFTYFIAG